jgi:hypothetical protein
VQEHHERFNAGHMVVSDGDLVNGTVSLPLMADDLGQRRSVRKGLASLMPASWNQLAGWLRAMDFLRRAA